MVDLKVVKDFYRFYEDNKEFIDDKFSEASGGEDLNIDLDMYQNSVDSGIATIFSIESEEKFVGYISMVVSPDPLNAGNITAVVDHFALDKHSRGKGIASFVLKEIETFLEREGISDLRICLSPSEEHKEIANSLGYEAETVYYKKDLGGEQW